MAVSFGNVFNFAVIGLMACNTNIWLMYLPPFATPLLLNKQDLMSFAWALNSIFMTSVIIGPCKILNHFPFVSFFSK